MKLLVNKIQTPDGTILHSRHVHDYVTHTDAVNGQTYMLDGGNEYRRFSGSGFIDLAVYDTDDIKHIRKHLERGTYGVDGKQPLSHVKLKDLSDDHLNNLIIYEQTHRPDNPYLDIYLREKEYRKNI